MRVESQCPAILFISTITVSSFLLFQVQPLVARFALPWFGGAPAVWSVCLLFFQALLLGGYAYAHWLNTTLRPKRQLSVHATLLLGSLFLLPLTPSDTWRVQQISNPTGHILAFLLTLVGLNYFLLASTAPLIQAWYARRYPDRSPYRLYAWSNTSALLALLSYPSVFEPAFSLDVQAYLWSGLYLVFLLLCIAAGVVFSRSARIDNGGSSPTSKTVPSPENHGTPLTDQVLWFFLPFCASVLLLAITNELCHDVAVVPFLWVAPLSLYLLSFILTFESSRWYKRVLWVPLAGILLYSIRYTTLFAEEVPLSVDVGVWCAILFVFCMLCHGEVATLKPEALQLTRFYLTIASGGAAGGLFVALFAPRVFRSHAELPMGLCLTVVLIGLLLLAGPLERALKRMQFEGRFLARIALMTLYAVLVVYIGWGVFSSLEVAEELIAKDRNFYGVLQVRDEEQEDSHWIRYLENGRIIHGAQYRDPEREGIPLTYYGPESGFGVVIRHYPKAVGRHIGAIGLGTGSIAGLTRRGDTLRFYEINPQVVRYAGEHFSFLEQSQAKIEIVLGDARISLEAEPAQGFDILVIDAFNGDAPPVHLLTLEAFELYRRHLAPGGTILIHISNLYFDFAPLVWGLSDHFKMSAGIFSTEDDELEQYGADWAIMTMQKELFSLKQIQDGVVFPEPDVESILWSDKYTSLFALVD